MGKTHIEFQASQESQDSRPAETAALWDYATTRFFQDTACYILQLAGLQSVISINPYT